MSLLKDLLACTGYSQNAVCREVGISPSTLSYFINQGVLPKKQPQEFIQKFQNFLIEKGVEEKAAVSALEELLTPAFQQPENTEKSEVIPMIRKQTLTQEARRKFQIPREIFSDELRDPQDVYFTPDLRYTRECLYQIAKYGGMLALAGESGSGKSTLRRDLISRLQTEEAQVIVIEPYILGLDKDFEKSKGVGAVNICQSIVTTLNPSSKINISPESLFKLTHKLLKESSRAGFKHLLIIEEAHCLPPSTIKQLKRFFELEDGMTKLLSIILIGQPELRTLLSETNVEVREVVQRMELISLTPLDDVTGYVAHKCSRCGVDYSNIFAPDALNALPLRLSGPAPKNGQLGVSMLYPLLVGNLLTKAINLAANLKLSKITADVIMSA